MESKGAFRFFSSQVLAAILVFQFSFSPLARAQTIPPQDPPGADLSGTEGFEANDPGLFHSTDPTQPASEAEAIRDAEELKKVIEGTSSRVRLRVDTYGFYDLLADESFASKGITVPSSLVEHVLLPDGRFELRYRNEKVLESRFRVSSVARFGDFLVFVEDGSYLSSIPEADRAKVTVETGIQYLSFIDLGRYSGMFGQTQSTPPVFTLPVASAGKIAGFETSQRDLVLLSGAGVPVRLPRRVLEAWSRNIYGVAIDVTARLLEPRTYSTLGGVVEELEQYFKEAADHAAMSDLPAEVRAREEIRGRLIEKIRQNRLDPSELTQDETVRQGVLQTTKSIELQGRVATRLRLLWQRLSFPAPIESAKTVKESLALMAYGLTKKGSERTGALKESGLQLLNSRFAKIAIRLGIPVASAAMLGHLYPAETAQFYYQALQQGSTVLHSASGFTRNLFDLGLDSVVETLKGLSPQNFYQAYLAEGKASKFAVGLGAIFSTGLAIIATPILVVNSWMLAKDLKKKGSFSIQAFIERQQEQLASHLKVQSETQKRLSERFGAESSTEFSAQDTDEVKRILAEISERERGALSKALERAKASASEFQKNFVEKVRSWRLFRKKTYDTPGGVFASSDANPNHLTEISELPAGEILDADLIAQGRIRSFGSALQSFLISYPSITEGFSSLVRGWNGFTIFRRVFWSPSLWVIQTLYPNFSNVALGDGASRELTIPSRANGGLDPTPLAMKRVFQFLTFSSNLDLIRAWEKKIIPVEKAILAQAMDHGFAALAAKIRSEGGDLKPLLQNLTSMGDPKFQSIAWKQKVFFMRTVESVTARSLQKFLMELAVDSDLADPEAGELKIPELKQKTLGLLDRIQIDPETAKRLVSEVVSEGLALRDANKSASRFNPAVMIDRLRVNSLEIVDPKNSPSFKRIQVVLEMMQKPESMPRAVRATLSSLVMAKLIGVGVTLIALSGMQGSVLQPFYPDEMFGPNSYFYMGRYPFVNGLLVGLGTAMMSNAWVKLQQDASHSDHFGQVPTGIDAKKSYLSWFYKQSFRNPENTFWGNQRTYWNIIWGNMKPAFVLMLVTNMVGLGRFDLDGYIAGYLLSFGIMNTGFNMMMEQGSEFASYYPLKDFPERLRGHPLVQEYLVKKQQVYRFYFAFFEKTFVDLQEMIIGNFERMGSTLATVTYKNEAFLRMLFGGFTPTEIVYSGVEWLKMKTAAIPLLGAAVEGAGNFCERLLTRGYTSWDKVKGPSED